MNTWQLCTRIQNLLIARQWNNDATAEPVFNPNAVIVTMTPTEDAEQRLVMPAAYIGPSTMTVDPEHQEQSDLISQEIIVAIVVCITGDDFGQNAIMGAYRGTNLTKSSRGRGLLEIESELWAVLKLLTAQDGVRILLRGASAAIPLTVENGDWKVWRAYRFAADVDMEISNAAPQDFLAVVAAPNVNMTWAAPQDTTDQVNYILRRVSGAAPVSGVNGGTGLTLSGPLVTSHTDAPGSGVFTYSLFAGYDSQGGTVAFDTSDFQFQTVTVP